MGKVEALRAYLESTGDADDAGLEIEDMGWELSLSDGREYIVMDDAERRERFEEDLRGESMQYFIPEFLAEQTGFPLVVFERLCGDGSGDVNDAVVALVESSCGVGALIDAAVAADGWGHFMSSYDGEEIELDGGYYAYRHN